MEREVDIRRRVAGVFNRRQDDFETLFDYNNYLEEVENLTFDLVNGTSEEKAKAEDKIRAYKNQNMEDIEENRRTGIEEAEMEKRREAAYKEAMRQRRIAAARQEEEEKMDVQKSKMDILERMATSNESATKIAQQANKVILKKSSARRNMAEAQMMKRESGVGGGGALDSSFAIRGLRKKEAVVGKIVPSHLVQFGQSPEHRVNILDSAWILAVLYQPVNVSN